MAGRPPKPTALKVLNGSADHDPQRLNREEPQPALGANPPEYLPETGPARSAWNRHAAVLVRIRVLTEADADALALGCMALAEYLSARRVTSQWRRADAAWKRYWTALDRFGLNPSGRTRIHAMPQDKVDPFELLLNRKKSG